MEHHGGEGFGDAVNLVQKQNPLPQAGFLHEAVDGGENFAHGVLGDGEGLSAVGTLLDEREAHSALAGVVGDGVGDEAHALLRGDLFHDLGFADAGRPHEEDRALPDGGNQVVAEAVFREVGFQRVGNLRFGLLDVHVSFSRFSMDTLKGVRPMAS